MLEFFENYEPYLELVNTGHQTINNTDINRLNHAQHFNAITNIFRDGIELEEVQKMYVTVHFDVIDVDLYLPDYWFNLMMWYLIVSLDNEIRPKNIFFDATLKSYHIKEYIDYQFLDENRTKYENITLNNIIDDCLWHFSLIDEFSYYLFNTFDITDFKDIWKQYPETKEIMAIRMGEGTDIDFKDVMPTGQSLANKLLDYMEKGDYCLANFVRAGTGVNPKQLKEVAVHIGIKPDGDGGIIPHVMNTNYLMGGVNNPIYYTEEASVGRIAQMIVKGNVGDSGYFARILKLNNADTKIYPNPHYDCCTKNYVEFELKTDKLFELWENSWYKETPNGVERLLTRKDKHLIGRKILLRTPITCASHARGEGICYKCYGHLAYENRDISPGTMSAEILSSKTTQMQLSAKHLLEAKILEMQWTCEFEKYFQVDYNMIKVQDSLDTSRFKLLIDPNDINLASEFDNEDEFNEYVNRFMLELPDGHRIDVATIDNDRVGVDNMYITSALNQAIRKHAKNEDEEIVIPLDKIEEIPLFMIPVNNNELSRTLLMINSIINKKAVTTTFNMSSILQSLIETLIEGKMEVMGVHVATIISNQIRDVDYILEKPDWTIPNQQYQLLTLDQSLTNYPDVTVKLSYEKIARMLYNPLTFKCRGTSYMDLFFATQPQKLIKGEIPIEKEKTDKPVMGLQFD